MVLRRLHLYVGVDYERVGPFSNSARRRHFGSDAKEIRDLLKDKDTESILLEGPIKRKTLKSAIRSALGPEMRDREVLIYFAGHTERDDKVSLVTSDGEDGDLGVELAWLLDQINDATAPRRVTVILDCCLSSCPGQLKRERYWFAGSGSDAVATNDFHDALVSCLAAHGDGSLSLQHLHSCAVERCTFSQPELSGIFHSPVEVRGRRNKSPDRTWMFDWQRRAQISLVQRGRLRTAFPTDLSFAELHAEGLFIPASLTQIRATSGEPLKATVSSLVDRLAAGQSLLVLGEPGSGKSFFSYLCQREMMNRGLSPLVIDLTDTFSVPASPSPSGDDVNSAFRPSEQWISAIQKPSSEQIVVIDSLDEAVSDDRDREKVRTLFESLAVKGPLLALCRRQDYENSLFSVIRTQNFDQLFALDEWRPQEEFSAYIKLLVDRGYADLTGLGDLVNNKIELQQLVRRPLHARMLSFLWSLKHNEESFDTPDGFAVLYGRYLDGFAKTCEERLRGGWYSVSPPGADRIRTLWRTMAWEIFTRSLLSGGYLGADSLSSLTTGLDVATFRGCRAILQERSGTFGRAWTYLHYSFYEFLVAESFTQQLLECLRRDVASDAVDLFRRDLTKEVRRFAVRLLRRLPEASAQGFSKFLGTVYEAVASSQLGRYEKLTAGNLAAYFLGRNRTSATEKIIQELLQGELEPFLRTSLYWAACQTDDTTTFQQYYDVLTNNSTMSELNRGYLMYYYGDWDSSSPPPYLDNDMTRSWSNTRQKNLNMMTERAYASAGSCRRAIDIVTFVSFLEVRAESLTPREAEILHALVTSLMSSGIEASYLEGIRSRVRALTINNMK